MKKFLLFTFLLISTRGLFAQKLTPQILSSAGTRYQTSTMTIDWTLGELSITTIQGSSNIITQGFHQPKYIITGIDELDKNFGTISVYPNPTNDVIQMNMSFNRISSVQVYLIDINGKQLWNNEYNGQHMTESTSIKDLPNGSYFLNFIIDGNKSSQTFKIQKLN